MAKKNVVSIIKSSAFSWKTFEALRQAVGMAMDHKVTVIFIKDAVYLFTENNLPMIGIPSSDKSIEALGMLEAKIVIEEESVRERGIILKQLPTKIFIEPKEKISEIISNAEVVITW